MTRKNSVKEKGFYNEKNLKKMQFQKQNKKKIKKNDKNMIKKKLKPKR